MILQVFCRFSDLQDRSGRFDDRSGARFGLRSSFECFRVRRGTSSCLEIVDVAPDVAAHNVQYAPHAEPAFLGDLAARRSSGLCLADGGHELRRRLRRRVPVSRSIVPLPEGVPGAIGVISCVMMVGPYAARVAAAVPEHAHAGGQLAVLDLEHDPRRADPRAPEAASAFCRRAASRSSSRACTRCC